MLTDAMEIDDGGLDMDMGGGYYSDNNDHTTPKSTRWVSHMIPKDGFHGE